MSDACHMTSMPHALASGLARSSLTLWGLSYILLCGGNSIDLRYTPPAFFGDTVTTRSDLFRSGDHLISATSRFEEKAGFGESRSRSFAERDPAAGKARFCTF